MRSVELMKPSQGRLIKGILNYQNPEEMKPYIDPSLSVAANKEREDRTVFVSQIPNQAEKKDILTAFRGLGKIEKFWMKKTDPSEASGAPRSCYLMFESPDTVQRALNGAGAIRVLGYPVVVAPPNEFESHTLTSVFAGNLDWEATEKEAREFFGQAGTVLHLRVLRDRITGKSKGMCFVRFQDEASVPRALALDGTVWRKKPVKVVRNGRNPELILKQLVDATKEVFGPRTAEELEELEGQNQALAKTRAADETHYGVTMMENLIKHQGKVPSSIIGKKIKKLRKRGLGQEALATKIKRAQEMALKKLNKEVFEKDNLLKERREQRKAKAKYNASKVKISFKKPKAI